MTSTAMLVVRADASTQIGIGHVMRCLALAQVWQAQGGVVIFITACQSKNLCQRLALEGFQVILLEQPYPAPADWEITSEVLATHPEAWVVLDGYHFDPTYQQRVKLAGHPLLMIDDMAQLDYYYADLVLNQNINAEQLPYSCEPHTRLLLGLRYVLLRSEFIAWRDWQREIPKVAHNILITLGGSDPDNQTLKVIRALQELTIQDLEVTVVVGASNPHFKELKATSHNSLFSIRLIQNATNMPELMAWADIAVSAGGSTCWELSFMGVPTVILVLAENQRMVARGLAARGGILNLGEYTQVTKTDLIQNLQMLIFDPSRRKTMSRAGRGLVDGNGVDRVLLNINQTTPLTLPTSNLRIRQADFQDAELLWQWANDPNVRANSFSSEAIPLEKHLKWYKDKLASPDTCIWILELDQVPVAQIRYDRVEPDMAEISFSVASGYRGQGLGTQALFLTGPLVCSKLKVKRIKGIVLNSNIGSGRAFVKAGFECFAEEVISGKPCRIFIQKCSKYS